MRTPPAQTANEESRIPDRELTGTMNLFSSFEASSILAAAAQRRVAFGEPRLDGVVVLPSTSRSRTKLV